MSEKYTYIEVNPLLTDDELNIFNLFNDILILNSQMKVNPPAIWLNDKKYPDNFEVISKESDKEGINLLLQQKISNFKQYCSLNFYSENLDLIINYKDLFFKTEITHINNYNYKINCYSSNFYIHLIKFIHFFHHNGLFKKMLNISVQGHTFSDVIIQGVNEEPYILDGTDIYDAILLNTGYYKKNDNLLYQSEEFLSTINRKIIFDKFSNELSHKEKNDKLQKI